MPTPIEFRDLDPVELRGDRDRPTRDEIDPDPTDDERLARKYGPKAVATDHFDFGPGFDPNPF